MKISTNINIINRFRKSPKELVRPTFKTVTEDGYVVHSDLPVTYKDGKATLSTICCESYDKFSSHAIYTQIKDANGKQMGDYSYSIDPIDKTIDYGFIKTKSDFRHKGIAEIMRLSSLMELKENFISALKIDAMSDAIAFHSRYKFQPALKGKNTSITILDSIINETKAGKKDKKRAANLIKVIENDNGDSLDLSPKCAKKVNGYIADYIDRNKNNWADANFHHCLPMILTNKQVNKFSRFYNKLFKKHGIDYTI